MAASQSRAACSERCYNVLLVLVQQAYRWWHLDVVFFFRSVLLQARTVRVELRLPHVLLERMVPVRI